MNRRQRERFDALFDEAIEQLPPRVKALLDEIPVIVLDRPTAAMLRDLGIDPASKGAGSDLCGLHTGTAITEKSMEVTGDLPTEIHLFREGIASLAGGWGQPMSEDDVDDLVYEEIMVTLLHEIGHHFGLDEDDLAKLGYD
jgi:predicted Zn-dependent protease with MMP-like domain